MRILLTIFILSFFGLTHAQTFEVGAWGGGINSFNDINTNTNFLNTTRPAGGVLGKYNFNERIAAQLKVSGGRTFSADEDINTNNFELLRNAASRTTAIDIALSGEFNFNSFGVGGQFVQNSSDFTPYLSAGVAVSILDVGVFSRLQEDFVAATSILTEEEQTLNELQFAVPLAGGLKYKINKDWVIAGEFGSRLLFTDYFDNISTQFNQSGIDHNPGAITTVDRQRGDRSRNDVYNLFGFQATYIIPTSQCPKF